MKKELAAMFYGVFDHFSQSYEVLNDETVSWHKQAVQCSYFFSFLKIFLIVVIFIHFFIIISFFVFWTPSIFFHPSVPPSGSFLGIGSLVFSETQHDVRGPCLVVCDRVGFFKKNLFVPKNGENGPKIGQKQGFLNLLENLVINSFWIWSVKKLYNICCILAQIPYLGKI